MTPLEAALALAAQGLAVFPMQVKTKRPACAHGVRDATRDAATVRRWFARPGVVPAIATGEPSGLAVLDIDRQHGGGTWWQANRQRLPATWTWRSRSGGLHLAFRHRAGLRSSVGIIAPGVDVRAGGASAIYWPAAGLPVLCEAEPASWPAWWIGAPPEPACSVRYTTADAMRTDAPEHRRKYGLAALAHACERVASAGQGTRNAALNSECFGLMRMVRAGALAAREVADALAIAALASGLDGREVGRTLASALRAGGVR